MSGGKAPARILVVKTSSLGDVVHTFAAVHRLRLNFPQARIDWLVHPSLIPLVKAHPNVDEVISYPRSAFSSLLTLLPAAWRLIRLLRRNRYDTVIDYQGLFRTAVFAGFSGAPRIIGFAAPREGISRIFYTEKYQVSKNLHAVRRYLELSARAFDISAEWISPEFKMDEESLKNVREFLPEAPGIRTIAVVPGARWESKCWPVSFFISLIETAAMRSPSSRFVIVGGKDEEVRAESILSSVSQGEVISAAGKTQLGELVALIGACDALVASDTGPLHIAAAMGKPTFSLFGPNDPAYSGPCGAKDHIYRSGLKCSPCMKRVCPLSDKAPPCHGSLNPVLIATEMMKSLEV